MKIVNVIRRIAFNEWGGTETAVWNTSKILAAQGNCVEIFATEALCKTQSECVDGLHIKRFPYFYPNFGLSQEAIGKLDKKGGNPFSFKLYNAIIESGCNVVHSHAMGRLAMLSQKAAAKQSVPSVLSLHGGQYSVPHSEFEQMASPLRGTLGFGRFIEYFLRLRGNPLERADGIVCVGENELEEVRRRLPLKPSVFIPNGVDYERFQRTPDADFKTAYNIPAERKLVICVSRIDPQKNQAILPSIAAKLLAANENVHFAVIGFVTNQSYLKKLLAEVRSNGVENRFTIVRGLAPDSEMLVSAYKQADFFILPSIHEPFGIVALEAWSAGVPVIAANVGGLARLVKDGQTGYLFEPVNPQTAVEAYMRAKENSQISELAKKLAREKYSWQSATQKLKDFYNSLI